MFFVSDIYTAAPEHFRTGLQEKVYQTLEQLQIPFARVDTDEAVTMEDCVQIDAKLDMKMVKTLFLCNRQQTAFYLFITTGDKPFKAKAFSAALEVARVSFAPAELMEQMLGTKIGAATVFSTLLDAGNTVQIVFDRLACVLSDVQSMGYEIILVSSGAIAVGTNKLKLKSRPTSMRQKQAAALATSQGIDTTITNGKNPQALYDLINGGHAGTLFAGKSGA